MPELVGSDLFKQAMGLPSSEDEAAKLKEQEEAKAAQEKADKEADEARQATESANQEAVKKEADEKDAAAKLEAEKKKQEEGGSDDASEKTQTYDEWFAENEAKLKQYLVEKDRDYKLMKPEDLLRLKYEKENPDLSREEVDGLLADDYSLGEQKIEIDKDLMDDDQIKAAETHNKQIDKALRKLNADAKKAAKEFESQKASLEKPVYKVPEAKADPTEKYTIEEFQEMAAKEQEDFQANQEKIVKDWIEIVDQNFKPSDKFAYNGVEVDLTKEEQDAIKHGVLTFQPRAGDETVYADEKGNVIWDKLTTTVAKSVLLDKLLDAAKELSKKETLKKMSNYTPPVTASTPPASSEVKTEVQTVEDIWARMK